MSSKLVKGSGAELGSRPPLRESILPPLLHFLAHVVLMSKLLLQPIHNQRQDTETTSVSVQG